MCIFVGLRERISKEPSLVFNMATTDKVVFREIGFCSFAARISCLLHFTYFTLLLFMQTFTIQWVQGTPLIWGARDGGYKKTQLTLLSSSKQASWPQNKFRKLLLQPSVSYRPKSVLLWIFTARRNALRGLSYRNCVLLSVRLSHSWSVSTWFELRSWFLHHMVAPWF